MHSRSDILRRHQLLESQIKPTYLMQRHATATIRGKMQVHTLSCEIC